MDKNKIIENIENNNIKLEKAEALLAKRLTKVEEFKAKLAKLNITSKEQTKVFDENWEMLDFIETWEFPTKYNERSRFDCKLKAIRKAIETWKVRLEKENKKQEKYTNLPEVLKVLLKDLENDYCEDSIRHRNFLLEKLKELGYNQFVKEFTYHAYFEAHEDDEKLERESKLRANNEVLNLYERIKEITGENIITYENVHYAGKALDGYVTGENGTAEVHTIYAGGYNIQCLHLRTLVHKIHK